MASLPLKLAIFFFIPKLPPIHQILPYYIGTRCYGSKRIQEGEGEPDTHYRILLSQRLTGTDTRTEMPAYRLADGKLEETYQQRNKEQQKHRNARYLGMKHVANRFAHQYREVETPHIKAQILYTLHFIHPFRQEPAAQQGQQQRHHLYGHRQHFYDGHYSESFPDGREGGRCIVPHDECDGVPQCHYRPGGASAACLIEPQVSSKMGG